MNAIPQTPANLIAHLPQATPAKLRDGSWGARVAGKARAGDLIWVKARNGKEWQARVTKVVWSGEGVTLVATESVDRKPARRERMGSGHGRTVSIASYSDYCTDNASCRCYDCAN